MSITLKTQNEIKFRIERGTYGSRAFNPEVGDVLIIGRGEFTRARRAVTKLTKTQITLEGGKRYSRRTGSEVGANYSHDILGRAFYANDAEVAEALRIAEEDAAERDAKVEAVRAAVRELAADLGDTTAVRLGEEILSGLQAEARAAREEADRAYYGR